MVCGGHTTSTFHCLLSLLPQYQVKLLFIYLIFYFYSFIYSRFFSFLPNIWPQPAVTSPLSLPISISPPPSPLPYLYPCFTLNITTVYTLPHCTLTNTNTLYIHCMYVLIVPVLTLNQLMVDRLCVHVYKTVCSVVSSSERDNQNLGYLSFSYMAGILNLLKSS